jgi:hypothetical protein
MLPGVQESERRIPLPVWQPLLSAKPQADPTGVLVAAADTFPL